MLLKYALIKIIDCVCFQLIMSGVCPEGSVSTSSILNLKKTQKYIMALLNEQ